MYLYYLSIDVIVRIAIRVNILSLVTRAANRAGRPRRHQDGAASATEALRAVFTDDRATAIFMTAARIVFAHSVFYFVVNYVHKMTRFLSESKGKSDLSPVKFW